MYSTDHHTKVPFRGAHNITDAFMVNNSIGNLTFSPHNCKNFLKLENKTTTRLAPLLCSSKYLNNVTQAPRVTTTGTFALPETVRVQLGAYGRFWLGRVTDLYVAKNNQVGLNNREGHNAAFTLGDYNAPVGGANPEIPSVWGFRPTAFDARVTTI